MKTLVLEPLLIKFQTFRPATLLKETPAVNIAKLLRPPILKNGSF